MTPHPTPEDLDGPLGCSTEYRTWFHEELPGPSGRGDVIVIMKNPSWPDHGNATLAEARRMATELAFSNLYVGNLFGRRAPKPGLLNDLTYREAVQETNDVLLELMAAETHLVVAAWGNPNGIRADWYERRIDEVVELLGEERFTSFGTTTHGHPRHCFDWRINGRRPLADWNRGHVARAET